ncbi:hypothetical protein ACIQUU_14670 [Streptomyces sp. NPDC101116]|uniref:hypothetical protein n=1 Tax=Streptomyces sp. NPDC101116 TaxID=3366107 RepID=UPI003818E4E0
MSQQYPQPPHPQQPHYGAPAPQPPKKHGIGRIAGLGCAGVLALFIIAAVVAGGGGDSGDTSNKDRAVAADGEPGDDSPKKAGTAEDKSQAEQFRSCVAENGTDTEKAAVEHVTKVTGADKRNDILDAAEVFTDFSGGLMGPHQGEGKLIASAFTSCYESKNGLVTVYDKDGELLANANY